ncbi:MAG: membrane protein insertion efficiency factor YidD [Clostridia bacterium]|nr:membrane protein insertion efficiency factor YidD [Clostridia bacterium]
MLKGLLIGIFKFYKKCISPLLPSACIYTPTCSEYAIQAVQRFGAVKGLYLAIKRILRCNPYSKGGLDPVPDKKSKFKWLY